jgi:hypothetical protein
MKAHEYAATADELVDRIAALIPAHPEIIEMDDPCKLFRIPGFRCDDIAPSLAQATWALRAAQHVEMSRPLSEIAKPLRRSEVRHDC